MNHYDLTPENKREFMQEDLENVKRSFEGVKENVDKAEALLKTLGLTDFELRILARRLLNDEAF